MKLKLLCILLSFFLLASCSGKKKKSYLEGKDFISLTEETYKAVPDKDTKDVALNLSSPEKLGSWKSSDFNLAKKPENILITNFNPNTSKSYSIYRNDNIYGSDYTPVIDQDVAYIVDNNNIAHAFDLKTKKNRWSQKLINKYRTKEFAGGGIAKQGNTLVATFGSNNIVALDASNGNVIWDYKLSNVARATPTIDGDYAYIITIDNRIYSLDIETGIPKWTISGAVERLGIYGAASPAVYDRSVVVPHSSGQLISIETNTGRVFWDLSLIKTNQNATSFYLNDIDMTPIIDNGTIYVCNYSGTFFAISVNDGSIKWVNDTIGGGKYMWDTDEFIFTVNKYSQLLAVYKLDGSVKWALDLDTGKKKSEKTSFNGPIMINSKLYISSSEGQLIEVNPHNGKLTNSYKIPKNIYSPPIASNNSLYLFSNQGTLTIIE
ncbi:MAG: PQQ-binding-like beta-propeller repeat protein [Rickettsiales bacterium]